MFDFGICVNQDFKSLSIYRIINAKLTAAQHIII
jgi:hypothetical protein